MRKLILRGGAIFAIQDCALMALGFINPNFSSVVSPFSAMFLLLLHLVIGIVLCSLLAFACAIALQFRLNSRLSLAMLAIFSGVAFASMSYLLANSVSWGVLPIVAAACLGFGFLALHVNTLKALTQ